MPATSTAAIPVLIGIFIIGFSTIATGVNFIVTVHTMRAPGIGWMRIPLFVWAVYGTAVIQSLATPVLGLTVLLVAVERFASIGIFDPTRGFPKHPHDYSVPPPRSIPIARHP